MVRRYTLDDLATQPGLALHVEHSVFPERSFEPHTHDFTELVVVQHGRAMHVVDDRAYPVSAGDVFVVQPNDVHAYRDMVGLDICSIAFDPELLFDADSDLFGIPGFHMLFHLEPAFRRDHALPSRLRLTKEQIHYVIGFVEAMEEELSERAPGYVAMLRAHFALLVGFLARNYTSRGDNASERLVRMSRVVAYIEDHYSEPLTLDGLAEMACMSRNTLIRAFRRCYGTTPMDYLIRRRLRRSTELLLRREATVTEVAYAVGFSNSSYYARQFRRRYGRSPSRYRREQLNG